MKIAVCFSGQPRFVPECSKSIIENVFQDYYVDVFAHLWFDEKLLKNLISMVEMVDGKNREFHNKQLKILKKYTLQLNLLLKEVVIFMTLIWKMTLNYLKIDTGWFFDRGPNYMERQIKNTLSNFYSMSEVNRLKLIYEYRNNFKYDWVFKIRTDVNVHQKIDLSKYNRSSFTCTSLMQQPPHINDWFCFGGSDIMDVFMGVFPMFQRIFDLTKHHREGVWDNETLHTQILDQMLINIERHPIQLSVPRF